MLPAAVHSLVLALAGITSVDAAATAAALAPGPAACKNLTTYLGSKVDSNPVDPQYLSSRFGYWNTQQSLYQPSCVVYPTSAQDVSVVIQGIRAAGSRFAIKAGGHNPNTFFSSVDKGVLVDLGSMTAKSYDAATTLGTYQPGGVFGDIYNYFAQYGRTVVGARLAGVGTGLALGGGLSYLSGQYGMACDSFRELEVVLPNGAIVTASPTQNSDLFFADKGGGGNAYGVVTKYTVQTRPSGTFYAGNIVYALTQINPVLQATKDFIQYNTDPKAAIITTYEILGVPGTLPNLNTNEAVLMFLVYDGPDSGTAFQNFTKIPSLINTLRQQPYTQVVNNPFPYSTIVSKGANTFRVGVHRASDQSAETALAGLRAWAKANIGSFELVSLDYEPVPKSLTDASAAQGGNAMLMPDGPWFWVNYLLTTPPTLTSAQYSAVQASFAQMVRNAGNEPGLPLFINDANVDQNPLSTYGGYSQLKAAKAKYDPDGFFSSKTGGWSFA